MTITTHLYIVRSPMYIQDTIAAMLFELFDTAVAGEVAAAAATRIQAAVRGRAICGSLNRLHALYPNAGALNLIARRISGGARPLNKNIFVFCSRTTRLPPLPKEVLVALISTRLSHCAHADQAPRDQPVASGRALGNAAPQQTDSQPVPQGTPRGEGSSARAEKAGTEGTGQLKRREAEKQAARRRAAEKQAARRRAAAARAAAAKVAAATTAAEAALQGQCQVEEWGGCSSGATARWARRPSGIGSGGQQPTAHSLQTRFFCRTRQPPSCQPVALSRLFLAECLLSPDRLSVGLTRRWEELFHRVFLSTLEKQLFLSTVSSHAFDRISRAHCLLWTAAHIVPGAPSSALAYASPFSTPSTQTRRQRPPPFSHRPKQGTRSDDSPRRCSCPAGRAWFMVTASARPTTRAPHATWRQRTRAAATRWERRARSPLATR